FQFCKLREDIVRVKGVMNDEVLVCFEFRKPLYGYHGHLVGRQPESDRARKSYCPSERISKRFTIHNQGYSPGPSEALLYGRTKCLLLRRSLRNKSLQPMESGEKLRHEKLLPFTQGSHGYAPGFHILKQRFRGPNFARFIRSAGSQKRLLVSSDRNGQG